MKDKLLILGSSGMIGHKVYEYLVSKDEYEIFTIAHTIKVNENTILLNARDEKKLFDIIEDISPKYIVNCMGILISEANQTPEQAIFLNAYLPHCISKLSREIDAKLIHISTDCVFSGKKGSSYIENDQKDGYDVYAKTKGLGEIINEEDLTIRTSVVGPQLKEDGEELFHWFSQQNGTIKGYKNALWSGVTSIELAKFVYWSIKNEITGLYHLTNNNSISKYELLNLFKKYSGKKIKIEPIDKPVINKSFKNTRKKFKYIIPDYDNMIGNMLDDIKKPNALFTYDYDFKEEK